MNIKIMTFNIQHGEDYINGGINLSNIAETIKKCGADIVSLNEVRGKGETSDYTEQAEIIAGMLGYYSYFAKAIYFPGEGPYGNALLSRFPILNAETILVPDPPVKDEDAYYETRCILKAKIQIDPDSTESLNILVSHFGLAKAEVRNAVKTVCSLIESTEKPLVFMGDLNAEPDDEKIKPLFSCLNSADPMLKDNFYSFPSDSPNLKIDYIFVSADVTVTEADIPQIIVSDHLPYTAAINI